MELEIKIGKNWLSSLSILFFLMVLFAHQREVRIETLMRYGSILFVLVAHWIDRPKQTDRRNHMEVEITYYILWILCLLGYGFLTLFWSIDSGHSSGTLFNIFKMLIVCVVISPHLKSQEDIQHIVKILMISLLYMLILCVLKTPTAKIGTSRMGSAIGLHPNDWARSCAFGSLLGLYYSVTCKKGKLFWYLLTALFFVFAMASGSKNALLILIFQLGLFLFLKSSGNKKLYIFLGAIVALAVLVYLTMEIPYLYNLIGHRFEDMFIDLGTIEGSTYHSSTSERLYFIRTAWSQFLEHPIRGLGFNNFSSYLEQIHYRNPKYSHCGFVELLSTTGIIGFLIYYSLFVVTMVELWPGVKKRNPLYIVLFVMVARIFVFDISTISMYTFNNYFLMMIAAGLAGIEGEKRETEKTG